MEKSIWLVSPQGHVEYNAKFVMGEKSAKKLEDGVWYSNKELAAICGVASFLADTDTALEKNIKKWKAVCN